MLIQTSHPLHLFPEGDKTSKLDGKKTLFLHLSFYTDKQKIKLLDPWRGSYFWLLLTSFKPFARGALLLYDTSNCVTSLAVFASCKPIVMYLSLLFQLKCWTMYTAFSLKIQCLLLHPQIIVLIIHLIFWSCHYLCVLGLHERKHCPINLKNITCNSGLKTMFIYYDYSHQYMEYVEL